MKDETLDEIAIHPPKAQDDLGRVRGLSAGWKTNDIGARLMAALDSAKPLDHDEMPDREPRRPGLTKDAALVSDLLKLLLKIRAKESGVAARLIARSDELEALAAGVRKDLNILVRLAVRAVRPGRARSGRRPARVRDRERKAQDEPSREQGNRGCVGLRSPRLLSSADALPMRQRPLRPTQRRQSRFTATPQDTSAS